MPEETDSPREAAAPAASIGVLEVVRVAPTPWCCVRITVAHADGPVSGWTPVLFDSPEATADWVADRSSHQVRPAVRRSAGAATAHAAVLDETGAELLVSAPVPPAKAAGVAALLAAELRARTR